MNHPRVAAVGLALAALTTSVLTALPAAAGQVKTHVVVELDGTSVSAITMTAGDTVTLLTHMDGRCLKAVEHAQNKSFGIAPSDDNSAVATLAPSLGYSGLECDSPAQSWTVHAVTNGDATLRFDPVVSDNVNGLQNQMAGTSVQVHVGQGGIPDPSGHANPAAPAVANAHVPHGSTLAGTCKDHYSGARNWHGRLIKDVAHWARVNGYNKTKDTYSDIAWSNLVTGYVDSVCNAPATT